MTKNVPSIEEKYELPKGLTRGKYDIDFAIGICNMVMDHCEQYKFSSSLYISLNHSLSKLKNMLQQEKQPRNPKVILYTCPVCNQSEIIAAICENHHDCNFCFLNPPSTQIEDLPD